MPVFTFTDIDHTFLEEQTLKADLVLVDLDGVILTPRHYLCSSYWYVNYIQSNRALLDNGHMSHSELVGTLYECMQRSVFIAVDDSLIAKLTVHSTTRTVIGLTGRTISFRENTEVFLDLFGMRFTGLDLEVPFKNESIFSNGIIYVGHDPNTGLPWNKGHALDVFLEKYCQKVQSILFIDDFLKNLVNLENYCKERNIEFVGIQYTKVIQSYETRGMDLDVLHAIASIQFDQLFSSRQYANVSNDQEVYDTIKTENMMCSIKPSGADICILEN